MALAATLVLIAFGAVVFHFASPWQQLPIASNWHAMDDALWLTFVMTGVAFVVLHLFMAFALVRYRHRAGHRASPEHGNRRLEWWLIAVTTVAIIGLLAPGLTVYAQLIDPPAGAQVFEVMGRQWQWHYRLPGRDGRLGMADARFITGANPFGIDPQDAHGQDDVLVQGQELHLPLDRPALARLRAQDVLHDFYVPQFRARMNMVPGMTTQFWFTPERTGRYEVLCAQLCGVGHSNMRSWVVIDEPRAYAGWLAQQPTFGGAGPSGSSGAAGTSVTAGVPGGPAEPGKLGRLLAQQKGCIACHSLDGSRGVGPSWKGLYGSTEALEGGGTAKVDDAYLRQAINAPQASIVRGYPPVMPPAGLSDAELAAVVDYIKTVR
ncbi:cytochrome c oxidase subunit II [Pseudoduganella umbonata]|uniref:cytochrome-c oxidase n=1 Tax=Pseudoduganella umbonata TaxID=864828 RepID=A0ABX5US61_9BURK|nr:cytochrome c oxidase subunit II [Pseudoduganella umbonata]QCP14637.1 c-type cytochrome [Pseudoduganella umbonata]